MLGTPAMVIAQTSRLILRHIQRDDADAFNSVFGDPEEMRFGDGVQTAQWVHQWVQNCLEHDYLERGFGPYAVLNKRSLQVMGYCGLFYFADVCGQPEVEIGYRLARRSWGRGYATEAARAVRNYGFEELGMSRLVALIDPANLASIQVAKKLGMRYEKDVMLEGYTHPDHVYALGSSHSRHVNVEPQS